MRNEFTGMLPAAANKFEELVTAAAAYNPRVLKGYDVDAGPDSFFFWGCACRINATDMAKLKAAAKALGIAWLSDDGDMAYTNGLTIADFKTYRVNGALELMPEKEV